MEAATNAKLEAEKNKHKKNLAKLEDEMDDLKRRLRAVSVIALESRSAFPNQWAVKFSKITYIFF